MGSLLDNGARIAPFTLPIGDTNETVLSSSILGVRRAIILVPRNTGEAEEWLQAAREQAGALEEREVTVVVISPAPGADISYAGLPSPTFQVLRDAYQEEAVRLGGAPAFYLVGKDGTIKRSSRDFPPLDAVLQQIDAMPMRQQEMRQSADSVRDSKQ